MHVHIVVWFGQCTVSLYVTHAINQLLYAMYSTHLHVSSGSVNSFEKYCTLVSVTLVSVRDTTKW